VIIIWHWTDISQEVIDRYRYNCKDKAKAIVETDKKKRTILDSIGHTNGMANLGGTTPLEIQIQSNHH
jgi:hypothetical protein